MNHRCLPIALAGFATVAVLTTSCSSSTGGFPTPNSSTLGADSSTTSSSPGSGGNLSTDGSSAPKVSSPLGASKFTSAPCGSLTAGDLGSLHLAGAPGKADTSAGAPTCEWQAFSTSNAAFDYDVSVAWLVPDTNGLSSLYAQRANQAYWQPTTVDGYPAVFASEADLRAQGTCKINVGVSDSLYFFVGYQTIDTSLESQSCTLAQQAATAVIKNLGGR